MTTAALEKDRTAAVPTGLEDTLASLFGFHDFRPHQREIVQAVLSGRDVFAVMPTGGGKSLCYQLPARLLPGAAVVVSPLIALMKDQVDNARATGLSAGSLNSSSLPQEKAETWRRLAEGRLDLLYVSPERLLLPDFLDELAAYSISFFAIDEAHCVSEWGHDFRPDYLGLSILSEKFPDKPIAAFTATATHQVADDIKSRLGLRQPFEVRASFNRPNLHYQVSPREKLESQIMDILAQYPGESGLVYRSTRKKVEDMAADLVKRGVSARSYHAGLGDEERRSAQDDFQRDRCQVIVATVAFGMGIDKSNVRFVIHGDLPKNLESYYQETGRAGRDGEPAHCALFFGPQEMVLWKRFAEEMDDPVQRRAALAQLRGMIDYAQRDGCRRRTLLGYFGEKLHEDDCGGCDICRGEVERFEATVPAQMALSAMVRTRGRFGSTHLADILVGADTARIRDNQHNLLPTYGVGKAYDRSFWRDVMAALLARGLAVNSGDDRYPTLAASPRANPILRGEEKFFILRTAVREKVVRRARREEAALTSPGLPPLSEELLALLKTERRRLANEANLPPYVVFSDRTLREMAQIKPTGPAAMLTVTGVGRHKLAQYGHQFMRIVDEYLLEHPDERGLTIDQDDEPPATERRPRNRVRRDAEDLSGTIQVTGEMLKSGYTLTEVAETRGLTDRTVLNHLEKLVNKSPEVFPSHLFISDERLEEIAEAFQAYCGGDRTRLRPVVEGTDDAISYDEAALARIFLQNCQAGED